MKYAYVICFVDPTNKQPPAFAHTFLEAENEADAYHRGYKMQPIKVASARFFDRPFNDYVFPCEEPPHALLQV